MATSQHDKHGGPPVGTNAVASALGQVFALHPYPMWVCDPQDHHVLAVNQTACDEFGLPYADFVALSLEDLLFPDGRDRFLETIAGLGSTDEITDHVSMRRHDGSEFVLDCHVRNMDLAGKPVLLISGKDVTSEIAAKRQLERQMAFAEQLFESSPEAIVQLDADDCVVRCNPAFTSLFGWTTDEARGRPLNTLIVPDDQRMEAADISNSVLSRRVVWEEAQRQTRDGRPVVVSIVGYPVYLHGDVVGIYGVYRDITEKKRVSDKLAYQAAHDDLTGLLNRRELARRANEILEHRDKDCVLLYIDLDQFKLVNDSSGHLAGDQLLCRIAELLHKRPRETDVIARLGGDEFALLLPGCNLHNAEQLASAILDDLGRLQFEWEGRSFQVSGSIGIALSEDGRTSFEELLRQADEACYIAKDSGRNRLHSYRPTDSAVVERQGRISWATLIPEAIRENRFELFAQRIVPVAASDDSPMHELLVRYRNNEGEIVAPGEFLSAAERYDLIGGIDRWVISRALAMLMDAREPDSRIAINLSGMSVGDSDLPDFIRSSIRTVGIDARRLCFEITETAAIHNINAAKQFIKAMHDVGARVALDDFGSGMSSFAYMKQLPVDVLKIDGQFIRRLADSHVDRGIVQAIVKVAGIFDLQTTAEFVEDEASLAHLTELGVDYAQGFHIHRPEPWKP
ncbi:MAG: EAL domain-containing protein [Gammaproteobacteria bacterium]|nr:EAL domain-containing protein [Gammaproteobacteria bacterium]